MDPGLQVQVDDELTRYEEFSVGIEELEHKIGRQLREYEDILNSYLNAVHIIQPKMDTWRAQRRQKLEKLCREISQKWGDERSAVRNDRQLEQDEQIFQAVLRIHYKKPAEQQAFRKERQRLIRKEIAKLALPQH